MRVFPWIIISVLLVTMAAWWVNERRPHAEREMQEVLADRGLEGLPQQVVSADTRLNTMIKVELGQEEGTEPVIDFNNPREQDLQFLFELLDRGTEAQRRSAGNVLVELGDLRGVRPLLRAAGKYPQEDLCSMALELLRLTSRAEAAELMIDTLETGEPPTSDGCRSELEERLPQVLGQDPQILIDLLGSSRPKVLNFALRRLPASPAWASDVSPLLQSPSAEVRTEAQRWWREQERGQISPDATLPPGSEVRVGGEKKN